MTAVRRAIGAGLLCAVLGLAASPALAHHWRACGTFRIRGATFSVTVLRGPVRCSRARHVLRNFLLGSGKMHGPPNGPAAEQTWTLGRWTCGHGAGGGACIRGGRTYKTARNWIEAVIE